MTPSVPALGRARDSGRPGKWHARAHSDVWYLKPVPHMAAGCAGSPHHLPVSYRSYGFTTKAVLLYHLFFFFFNNRESTSS